MAKMHDDEFAIDGDLVQKLIATQFPAWAHHPLTAVLSAGTDNAIFRLGDDLCVRLPRLAGASRNTENEHRFLERLSRDLPLPIPAPIAKGQPSDDYPWHWSICPWLHGEDASRISIAESCESAIILADFLKALARADATDGPSSRRSGPLSTQDSEVQRAFVALREKINCASLANIWRDCLNTPPWAKAPVWTHGDLLPTNLLVKENKLCAVIDFDLMGVGDPACDMIAAWSAFNKTAREVFRTQLGVDDGTWQRGRGWALSIAVIIIPYYEKTNPRLVTVAYRIINEILAD